MKKVLGLLSILIVSFYHTAIANDPNENELLSFITTNPNTVSQEKVASILGSPIKIEEFRKRVLWHYKYGNSDLVISWNKKSELADKFSFRVNSSTKPEYNNALSRKLKSGETDITQALKILGSPHDMIIKPTKQEMHYNYNNKVLRLFFRDRKLVDFCLY